LNFESSFSKTIYPQMSQMDTDMRKSFVWFLICEICVICGQKVLILTRWSEDIASLSLGFNPEQPFFANFARFARDSLCFSF
jgi:hypothetical protein